MENKTNVMRILDAHHTPYKSYSYVGTGATSGDAVAAALHQNPAQVFKTLVTVARSGIVAFHAPNNGFIRVSIVCSNIGIAFWMFSSCFVKYLGLCISLTKMS